MRKSIIAVALSTTLIAVPATADAKSQTICEKAYNVRMLVIKKHGKRAPGRNICRFGITDKREATTRQKARYLRQLRTLVAPAPYRPLLTRVAVAPQQKPAGTLTASVRAPAGGTLASIRQCESGGNYATNTGNGYFGAYQFNVSTWRAAGGTGMPHTASPAEQDRVAAGWIASGHRGAWPNC